MSNPEVCILKTDGVNCDEEMAHAFSAVGAEPEIVHINQLRSSERKLAQYSILAIPGGFSYGDDIASGKVLATELTSFLSDQLQEFVDAGKPIIGVCNGFQVLVRTGLLPNGTLGKQEATLARNDVGRFDCRWIDMSAGRSVCRYVSPSDFRESLIPMQTAHGEGLFDGQPEIIQQLIDGGQVVFRYANPDMSEPVTSPHNPNGSVDNIAGVCDPTGLILGMMPHPERSIFSHHPHHVRTRFAHDAAEIIFKNIVNYANES